MGPRPDTQRHSTFCSFFFHVIFYVIVYFKINIIILHLFSCQKTILRPSFKTKTRTLVFKTKIFKIRSRDQDPSLENSVSGPKVSHVQLRGLPDQRKAASYACNWCNCVVQIFGGNGYNTEYPAEKLMRDAKIFQVIDLKLLIIKIASVV